MGRLIDIDRLCNDLAKRWSIADKKKEDLIRAVMADVVTPIVVSQPTVDAVPVVKCKECKHRPTGTNRDDLEFPDDKCPCKCEDYWYSWKPLDNWFCGNGELDEREGELHEG